MRYSRFILVICFLAGASLRAATNSPVLNLADEGKVVVSNTTGWTYTLQYTTNLSAGWSEYVQYHLGRGTTEEWSADFKDVPQQLFYRTLATNYTVNPSPATGDVSIVHYPAQGQTGRVWRVALHMVNTAGVITNIPSQPYHLYWYTPGKLGDLFFRDPLGANAFLKEASGGLDSLSGTVIGWLQEPEQNLSSSDIMNNMNYYFGLADPYIRYADYDVHTMHARVKGSGQQTGWLYPEQSFSSPQGPVNGIGVDWMVNSHVFDLAPLLYSNWSSDDTILPTAPWIHEFIHTMGISGHANSWNCGSETLSENTTNNPSVGYGNPFSIMGERAFGTHPDASMKQKLGWITSNQIYSVVSNGTYLIYPLELADGQTKALSVPVNPPYTNNWTASVFDHFLIEYRRPIGFDRYQQRLDGSAFLSTYKPTGAVTNNGVLVYMENPGSDTTFLLDMHPTSSYNASRGIKSNGNVGKFADAMLNVGETFTWHGLSIIPVGTNANGAMKVTVSL